MKRNFGKLLGLKKPSDGHTEEEKLINDLICNNVVEEIYGRLPTSRMKAIVAMHFELGYDTTTLSQIFDVSQPQIALDIHNIKKLLLGGNHRAQRNPSRKVKFNVENVLWTLMQIQSN